MTSKRIEYIDLAKGICIVLVVLMHIVPEIMEGNPFFRNLRMPLYYCLSGLFFKTYGNFKNFIIKKADKLIIPLVAWYLISHLIYYMRVWAIGYPERRFYLTDIFLADDFYNGAIWFLLSLFWCNLIYFGIERLMKNELVRFALVCIVAFCGLIWSYADVRNVLYLGTSMSCLPFFYFGKQFLKFGLVTKEKNKRKDLMIIGICIAVILMAILLPSASPLYIFYLNMVESGHPLFMYLSGIGLVLSVLIICKYINRIPYISYLGRYSIIVLLTHRLLQNIFTRSIEHVTGIDMTTTTAHFILFFVIMGMMVLIIPFCRRFLPYICAQKSLLEDKILRKPQDIKVYNT